MTIVRTSPKAIADRAITCGLILLIALTAVVRLTSGLPASNAEIASLVAQARGNPEAARLVADALTDDGSPSKGELHALRRKVLAMAQATNAPADAMRTDNALAIEAGRLSRMSFLDMTIDDQLRWGVLAAGRVIPALLVGLIVWYGWRAWKRGSTQHRSVS